MLKKLTFEEYLATSIPASTLPGSFIAAVEWKEDVLEVCLQVLGERQYTVWRVKGNIVQQVLNYKKPKVPYQENGDLEIEYYGPPR